MWLTLPRLVGVLSPLPLLIACASGAPANVITAPELDQAGARNAYDAIREIRPEMLRTRSSGSLMLFSASKPSVAIDNTVIGGVEALRGIPTDSVTRIEYVSEWHATKAFGPGFDNGLMLVTMRTD
jgi:hypothetical protein